MNFLLVAPRFVSAGRYYNFPIGLAYISSYLKNKGFNVFCLNLCHIDSSIKTEDIIAEWINEKKIDVFCTGTMSIHWDKLNEILQIAKKIKPDIITVVGGAVIISDPELALRNMPIDYGVIGEGEETMAELASALINDKDKKNIKGLAFIDKNQQFIITGPRDYINDLDSLPFPDYSGFNFEKWFPLMQYSNQFAPFEKYSLVNYAEIAGSRSCPFQCTFCYHHLGQKYRQRSLDSVFAEIDYLVNNYQINFIYFLDELFSVNHQRMMEFSQRIKKYSLIGWAGFFRVNDVNPEILEVLKDSGLSWMGYGVESVSDKILKSLKKNITRKEIDNALKITREAGIYYSANIILGDVEETKETINESISWWKKHPEYNISLGFIKAIPNAVLYQHALKNNIIKDKLQHIKDGFPILNLTKLSDKYFFKLQSQVALMNLSQRHKANGRLLESKRSAAASRGNDTYDVKVECPFCHGVSEYKKYLRSLYTNFVCYHCYSINKVDSVRIFKSEKRKLFRLYFSYFLHGVYNYFLRFKLFKEHTKSIKFFSPGFIKKYR